MWRRKGKRVKGVMTLDKKKRPLLGRLKYWASGKRVHTISCPLPPKLITEPSEDGRMGYNIKVYEPSEPHAVVELSFWLAFPGWCELEKSPEWAALEALVGNLQKQHNPPHFQVYRAL